MTRVAVVTGGAGAIGASIVSALGQSGHTTLSLDQAGDPPVDLSTRRPRSTGPTWPRRT